MTLKCNVCGKPVSTEVPDGTVVMAFIECPECIVEDDEDDWGDAFDRDKTS
jgi:hypothetical protein